VRRRLARLFLAAGVGLFSPAAFSADTNGIVVQVGKQAMSVGELQRRWYELPAPQRQALGKTDRAALQAYVDRFVVPELLMAEMAAEQSTLPAQRRTNLETMILQMAMAQLIRRESEVKSPVTDADVRTYLEAHRQDFEHPERLRLFRILVGTEAEAQELIKKAHQIPDFDAWRNLAREKSLDKATGMRGGELGFVSADGHSDRVELEVDPALYAAAARAKDGELVKAPVPEKDKFAVVWRRGHVSASHASLSALSSVIRAQLRESRAQKSFEDLLSQLRAKYLKDVDTNPLEALEVPNTPGSQARTIAPSSKPDAAAH